VLWYMCSNYSEEHNCLQRQCRSLLHSLYCDPHNCGAAEIHILQDHILRVQQNILVHTFGLQFASCFYFLWITQCWYTNLTEALEDVYKMQKEQFNVTPVILKTSIF
jgi:hypothetical protein